MRRFMLFPMVVPMVALVLSAAEPSSAAKKQTKPPAPQPVALKPIEIPADAVQTGPGTYHYTDKDGKGWNYRKTSFGVMRAEEKPAAQPETNHRIADIKASEDGEIIRFERTTPFGVAHWQKKKSELNDAERAAWEQQTPHENPK